MSERASWGQALGRSVGFILVLVVIATAVVLLFNGGWFILRQLGITGRLEIIAVVSATAAVVTMAATAAWQWTRQARG